MARHTVIGDRLFCVVVIAVALAIYWPALSGDFIWDDGVYLTENPQVQAADGLYRIWFTREAVDYWPASATSFWLEWKLWRLTPTGYHVTNVLLHAASALLFWRVLRRLSLPAAKLAAFLFLVHPMNVESVAYIAQRKGTLSLLFCLLSILWYIAGDLERKRPAVHYALSLAAFALAMLSKGSAALLPAMLLLVVWWRRDRIAWPDLVRIAPFAVISVGLTLLNVYMQTRHTGEAIRDESMANRIVGAGAVVWFYLYKALVPITLMFVYPQWHVDAGRVLWWVPLAAAATVTVVLALKRRVPAVRALLFAWCFFVLALVPVMGLADAYFMRYSLVADHYAYTALLAVTAGVAAIACSVDRVVVRMATIAVVIALAAATWRQAHDYADATTLYAATLERNPGCWLCETNMAIPLIERGTPADLNQAIAHLSAAARLNPGGAEIHDGLGVALQKLGRTREAVSEYERALERNPRLPALRTHASLSYEALGVDLSGQGRFEEAATAFRRSLVYDAGRAGAHRELGYALLQLGRGGEAMSELNEALRIDPQSAATHDTLGALWRSAGRPAEALNEYRAAVRLAPNVAGWHNNLGAALLEQGQFAEAAREFREALRCDSTSALAHRNLGVALAQMNELSDAAAHFSEAVRLDPMDAEARADLAEVLTRIGRRKPGGR